MVVERRIVMDIVIPVIDGFLIVLEWIGQVKVTVYPDGGYGVGYSGGQ